MECTVNWMPAMGMGFVAETGSGHVLTMDGAPDGGGRNLAPRPMETVLAGTGGCTAYDVVLILKRGRHDVRGCQVKMRPSAPTTDPKVFTTIHMHFTCHRQGPAAGSRRARHPLSHERYCSASIMLAKTAAITTSHEIVRPDRGAQMRCAVVGHHRAAPASASARRRQRGRAGGCVVGMARFVVAHLVDDGTRGRIGRRQALEMAGQMLLDLALGLDDEAQAGASPRPVRPAGRSRTIRRTTAGSAGSVESPSSARRCCVQAR
jgi:putative redox protein